MRTLEEAWRWYESTLHQLELMRRLGTHYWMDLPWESRLLKDDYFRSLEGNGVVEEADFGLMHLSDLAVVVLFSVFESLVRERVLAEIQPEAKRLTNRALKLAAEETMDQVAEGSFFQVLKPFKDERANLVEEVNQVRKHRNWVAHGKSGSQPENVVPKTAYQRLRRFLTVLGTTSGEEQASVQVV
jgi:hypothetical protein